MNVEQQVDKAVETSRARDVDIYFGDLAKVTEGMPTLLERFLTDDETFHDWFGDAAYCAHDQMSICAMRPLFESIALGKDDYADLGHLFYSIVISHMETASKEAQA